MKKIFTLIAMAMMAIAMHAQSNDLQFCYADGTVVPSGSVVVINTPDPELLADDEVKFESGMYIKNTTSGAVNATLSFKVTEISAESELSVCLGTQCQMYHSTGNYDIKNVSLKGGSINNMQCHWSPAIDWDTEEYAYGSSSAEYTLKSGSTACSTITIKFVYADPTSISTVSKKATVAKTFDITGRQTTSGNGILIQKMSDGSVRKVVK